MADLESLKGSNNGGKAPQGKNAPLPSLPGVGTHPDGPPPNNPGDYPQPVNPEVPKTWADPVRIIRLVLDLYEQDPAEATRIHDFARKKLAEMAARSSK